MRPADWLESLGKPALIDDDPEAEARLRADRAEAYAKMRQERLERSVPRSYRWATFDAPELAQRTKSTTPLERCREAARHSRLLFHGPARSGKTSAACAMLREWVRVHEQDAIFVHAFRLGTARIQHRAGDGEAGIVERAMRSPLVLIDDVGSERDTANNAIVDVVFERHAEDLPTWITTGLDSKQLAARYGAGFLGRIVERATMLGFGTQMAMGNP